jgi:hypothetical protein
MKTYIQICIIIVCFFISMCGQRASVSEKNECYSQKLARLEEDPAYRVAIKQFTDSFTVLVRQHQVLQYRKNFIDNAIFFDQRKEHCIILILQTTPDLSFARAVRGDLRPGKWVFSLSREYIFEEEDFKEIGGKSINNLSRLGRYVILTDGHPPGPCDIDEKYWFTVD